MEFQSKAFDAASSLHNYTHALSKKLLTFRLSLLDKKCPDAMGRVMNAERDSERKLYFFSEPISV